MEQYSGKSIFNGTAVGKVFFYTGNQQIKRYNIIDIEAEILRYEQAKRTAIKNLNALYERTVEEVGEVNAKIFQVHSMMLEDTSYNDLIYEMIREDGVNAEFAVSAVGEKFSFALSIMEDEHFMAKAVDIKDISKQLETILLGMESKNEIVDEPVILVAEELSPSELVRFDKTKLLAIVTQTGSFYSHTAILARAMNIPALTGIEVKESWNGRCAILDGKQGIFMIEPDNAVLERYAKNKKKQEEENLLLTQLKGLPDITKNGKRIRLYANIGSVAEVESILENNAAGIGLFRSEFLYLEKDTYPTEEELFLAYKTVVQRMEGKPVIIRTLDIGADKQVDYLKLEKEANPAMGYRAIRFCLDYVDIFKTQLRAIYRAAAFGTVSILVPMIISVKEVQEIKKICEEVKAELEENGILYGKAGFGIMIETPAAVMISDMLAKEVDFFSIGTNDLTQYTLAIDRQNAKLDSLYDSHHPAVLRMIQMTIDNAHKEGCLAGICGELAADLTLTEQFVKMGIDELSVSPNRILPTRKVIREIKS